MNSTRVLTVDDSRTMLDMLRVALVNRGFEVVQAENGREGLEALKRGAFDVVISDVNMPVMDGFTFIRNLRKEPAHAGLPVLILTTETSREKRDEGRAAGATGWIVKPFDPEKLVATIRKVCPAAAA
jgi:two-component system, chemotaxis family, chemotaxis protein CheY